MNFIDISILQDETFPSMVETLIIKNKNDSSKRTLPLLLAQSQQENLATLVSHTVLLFSLLTLNIKILAVSKPKTKGLNLKAKNLRLKL